MRGCHRRGQWHPQHLLRPVVVVAVRAVKLTTWHTALLETGVRSCRDRDHSVRAFPAVRFRHRVLCGRHVSRELRSGNPRRRFDMGSKAVLLILVTIAGHLGLQERGVHNLIPHCKIHASGPTLLYTTLVRSGQRKEPRAVRRECCGTARGGTTTHQRGRIGIVIQSKYVTEFVRDDVAHCVRQRQRRNVRTPYANRSPASCAPSYAERNEVGLRECDHDIGGHVRYCVEQFRYRWPASNHCFTARATQNVVRNRIAAHRCRIEVNTTLQSTEFVIPVCNRFARWRNARIIGVADDRDAKPRARRILFQPGRVNATLIEDKIRCRSDEERDRHQ